MLELEIISNNLNVIGGIMLLIVGILLTLLCFVQKEKLWILVFGILSVVIAVLLGLSLFVHLIDPPVFLFELIAIIMLVLSLVMLYHFFVLKNRHN